MNEPHRFANSLLKLCDVVLLVAAFALVTAYRVHDEHRISLERFLSLRTKISNFLIFLLALAICHVLFKLCGLYRSRRLSGRSREVIDVLRATTACATFFMALSYIFSIRMITTEFLALFWATYTVAMIGSHLVLRRVGDHVRTHGRDLRYVLILGSNARAMEFARQITTSRELGYRLLGFVDEQWPGLAALEGAGFRRVSDFAGLAEYLRRNVVDEVAIYVPFGSFYRHGSYVATLCQLHGITMRIHSDLFDLKTLRWRLERFAGGHYLSTYTHSSQEGPRTLKRIIDVVFSATSLIFLSPLMILAALAIKLTSPGPVFFRQERIGVHNRRFSILKFRTMVPDAEARIDSLETQNEASGPVFKIRNDPRITPLGRWLRRSSIDELPQLWNVLIGDMSLVGPRPLPVRDYEGFNQDWQRRRFSVKPGITCLWQIGGRTDIPFDQWMKLDLQYLDEWSLWLDLKILTMTVPAVLRGAGAA